MGATAATNYTWFLSITPLVELKVLYKGDQSQYPHFQGGEPEAQ